MLQRIYNWCPVWKKHNYNGDHYLEDCWDSHYDALLAPADGTGGNIQAAAEVVGQYRQAINDVERGAPWGVQAAAEVAQSVVSAWLGIKEA